MNSGAILGANQNKKGLVKNDQPLGESCEKARPEWSAAPLPFHSTHPDA